MKKVLFATTALLLSAGVASAEVSLGGFGYLGMKSVDGDSSVTHATRLTYSAATETNDGISMSVGGRLFTRADNAGTAAVSHQSVTVSSGSVRLIVGGTNGAMRSHARVTAYHGFDNGGMLAADNSVTGAQNDGGNNVHLRYAMGSMSAGVSTQASGDTTEVGVSYSAGNVGFGVGINGDSAWMASGSYTLDAIKLAVGLNSDEDQVLSVTYTVDARALNLGYENNTAGTRFGVQATYDLGGGANAIANFAQNADSTNDMGVGVQFSF